MVHNLFFIATPITVAASGETPEHEAYLLGPKTIKKSTVYVMASNGTKDLFHLITDKDSWAEAARGVSEFIGYSYIEIILKSLLGILSPTIAKKVMRIKYVDPEGEDGATKIGTVEQWEAAGSPELLKVLKPHNYLGVPVD